MSPPTDDTGALGPWDPLGVEAVADLFAGAPFLWWVAGGFALDLFVGRETRHHDDIDVSILRDGAPLLRQVLTGWDVHLAHDGTLTPWTTDRIARPCNSVWCRSAPDRPWCLQIMCEEGSSSEWVCRRHPSIRLPMEEVICHNDAGIPYVAPQVQLFMKAADTRTKDDADYAVVSPLLSPDAARWLRKQLRAHYPTHDWLV